MKSKTRNRIGFISSNALRQISVSVFGMMIPFIVIHFFSKEIWSEFVPILLYTLFAVVLINWGNKEYLLRHFSNKPSEIKSNFSTTLATRLPLVFLFGFFAFFIFPIGEGFFIFLWLFGRYLSHAVEPILFFEKKFNKFLLIEIIAFLLFYGSVLLLGVTRTNFPLLILYSLYQFGKGVFSLLVFRAFIKFESLRYDFAFYKKSFPFFVLTSFGFLISKSDVYLVQYFCDPITTAHYQILNGLLVFIISISVFIYTPFTKNIYRNNAITIKKYQKALAILGIIIVPITLFFCYLIIRFYLRLELGWLFYVLAFIYIYPSYLYGIQIVNKFKANKEKLVILYLFCSAITNVIFSSLFLYLGYGIIGALSGSCLSQLVALHLFYIRSTEKIQFYNND